MILLSQNTYRRARLTQQAAVVLVGHTNAHKTMRPHEGRTNPLGSITLFCIYNASIVVDINANIAIHCNKPFTI